MREAGIVGPIVSWDDVLHEGPVPNGLNTNALREQRTQFLAGCGWGSVDTIGRALADRDAALERAVPGRGVGSGQATAVDEVVLWFEFDLYDQLQVLQILDRLPVDGLPRVTAVADEEYLGHLPASRFGALFDHRRDVTSAERIAARDAWAAFRSPDPRAIVDVLPRVTVLAHMRGALTRHLQQFPSILNGLSRTEQQALEVVAGGVTRVADVYAQSHLQREAAVFMGDSSFLVHLASLLRSPRPLIRSSSPAAELALDATIDLTDDGRGVLSGALDRVRDCGIDRWLGGVQVSGHGPVWRWDDAHQTLRMA